MLGLGTKSGEMKMANKEASTWIRDNHCSVSGQFGGLLAGWAGTPGLFPPSYLSNSVVEDNVLEGFGKYGIVFADFLFLPDSSGDEVNRGHSNLFQGNDLEQAVELEDRHLEIGMLFVATFQP